MIKNGVYANKVNPIKLSTLRPLDDPGFSVKKGEIVKHVMITPEKDLNRDYLYVAATEADQKNYAGFYAALAKYRNSVKQAYSMELEAINDLVSPSKRERVNTFLEIYKDDPVKVSTQLAEFNERNYKGQYKETKDQQIKKYLNMSTKDLKRMGYYTYANSWFDPEAGTLRDMSNRLKAKGYNALVDDNDKRSFMQSQAPLIVFDVMDNLKEVKVSKLSNFMIRQNMIDWQNMKHAAT